MRLHHAQQTLRAKIGTYVPILAGFLFLAGGHGRVQPPHRRHSSITRQLREEDMSITEPATTAMHGLNPKP
jgi:hypothetical protein